MSVRLSTLMQRRTRLREALHVRPPGGSLRTAINSLDSLGIDSWAKREVEHSNRGWTGQCNGITTDGLTWLVTSNRNPPPRTGPLAHLTPERAPTLFPGVFEVDDAGDVIAFRHIDRLMAGHVGDLDLHGDRIYVALEKPNQLWVLDRDLIPVQQPRRIETTDGHFAWCAIHPWNGLLYTSTWEGADRLFAHDPATAEAVPGADIALNHVVDRVQGGAFSPDGRVYLACDEKGTAAEAGVHAYSSATGTYLGHLPVEVHHGAPKFEEIEGVGYGPRVLGAREYLLHVVLLDQDPIASGDDIHLKSYGPREALL